MALSFTLFSSAGCSAPLQDPQVERDCDGSNMNQKKKFGEFGKFWFHGSVGYSNNFLFLFHLPCCIVITSSSDDAGEMVLTLQTELSPGLSDKEMCLLDSVSCFISNETSTVCVQLWLASKLQNCGISDTPNLTYTSPPTLLDIRIDCHILLP